MIKSQKIILFLSGFLLLLVSCTPQKKLLYLQNKSNQDIIVIAPPQEYKLQPGDVLLVRIQSLDETSTNMINPNQQSNMLNSGGQNSDGSNLNLTGFSIDSAGFLDLPMIGKIQVSGLTLLQAKEFIQLGINKLVKDAYISVKLLSFKVTILGEVNSPGIYRTYDSKLTILDAISLAGDLTIYGNRKIIIKRENAGKTILAKLNLTDRNLLNSEYYYLKPNDVIYVESLPAKNWGFSTAVEPITFTLSLISTTLLIINYFQK